MEDDKKIERSQDDDKDEYEQVCYICRRTESKAGKMIRIPNNISICQECMQKTFDAFPMGGMGFPDFGNMAPPNTMQFTNQQEIPKRQKIRKKKTHTIPIILNWNYISLSKREIQES